MVLFHEGQHRADFQFPEAGVVEVGVVEGLPHIARRPLHLAPAGQVLGEHPERGRLLGGGLEVEDGRFAERLDRLVVPAQAVLEPAGGRRENGALMVIEVLVREQAAERRDALLVLGALHQVVRPVFPPDGRFHRNHLHDLPAVLLPHPGILVPIRGRLGIAAGGIVQPHLHLVVFQERRRRNTLHVQGIHHVESLLVQAGRYQAERRGAAGLHPRVGELRRGRQPGHLLRVCIGRIVLVALVLLIQGPRVIVPVTVVQRRPEPSPQLHDAGFLLRVVLPLLRQLRIQLVQPRLAPLPPLHGQQHKKKQRDEMDNFPHHAAR